jgi:competence protein ComEC
MWLGMVGVALAQVSPPLAAPLNVLCAPLLGYLEWVAHVAAGAPLAAVPVRLGGPLGLALAYAIPTAVVMAAIRLRRARPRVVARGSAERRKVVWLAPTASGADAATAAGDASSVGSRAAAALADDRVGGSRAAAVAAGSEADGSPVATVRTGGEADGSPVATVLAGPEPAAQRRRTPLPARLLASPRARLLAALAVATATLIAAVAGVRAVQTKPPQLAPGELVVSFLDVGQGDPVLLQRDGLSVLVDTGPPGGPILQRLDEAGVDRLDLLVLTHAEADHEGMALPVIAAHRPRMVLDGGAGWPTAVQRGLPEALARSGGGRAVPARAGQLLRLGPLRFEVLWPPAPSPGWRPDGNPNDRALVAHVRDGTFDLLLPADAESNVTAALDLPRVEALKVAHHGSADEGLPELLERTAPRIAAIEVGRNSYGHPAPSTLGALRVVPELVRTDRDGTVRLHVKDGAMRLAS